MTPPPELNARRHAALACVLAAQAAAQCTPGWLSAPRALTRPVEALASWDPDGARPAPALLVAAMHAPEGGVTAWDGQSWTRMGDFDRANALFVFHGELIAAGGLNNSEAVRWMGSFWQSVGAGQTDYVVAFCVDDQDRLFAATAGTGPGYRLENGLWVRLGYLTSQLSEDCLWYDGALHVGGIGPLGSVVRWTNEDWVPVGTPPPFIAALGSYAGALVAVGAGGVYRWTGLAWTVLGGAYNVESLLVSGNDLYVGGLFTTIDGVPANRIARFDGGAWHALGPGVGEVNGRVSAMVLHDGDLYAGGSFSSAGGMPAGNLARWGCSPCYPNCDRSPAPRILNVNDFVCFLSRFAAADPYADCNHDTALNVNDLVCFQAAFASGCP